VYPIRVSNNLSVDTMRCNHVFATHDFYHKLLTLHGLQKLQYFILDTVYLLTKEGEAGDC